MSELLFNIDNLITPKLQRKMDSCISLDEKIDFMFKLTEFTSHLNSAEIDEVNKYYFEKTGERYEEVSLSEDDKEFIKEYAACYPDLVEIKKIINGLCYSDTYDECIAAAQAKIRAYRIQQQEEASEKAKEIHTNLVFDDDIPKQNKQIAETSTLPTLMKLLADAQKKANEINSNR